MERQTSKFPGAFARREAYANRARRITGRALGAALHAFFLAGFCFVILYPLLTMVIRAFMDRMDLFDNAVILVPRHFTLQNFQVASILLDYGNTLRNTMLLSAMMTLVETFICLLVGYGFGRFQFPLKKGLIAVLLFTIVVPPQLLMTPVYMQFRSFDPLGLVSLLMGKPLNLINTPLPFLLLAATASYTKNGLFVYLFRQYFQSVPNELEEAAQIDGAGSLRTFFQIMLPNAKTMITTVALFAFIWQYNDVVFSRIFLNQNAVFSNVMENLNRFTNEVYTFLGVSQYDVSMELYYPLVRSTGTLMVVGPLILAFGVAQRFFVDSIERSGLVG